MKMEEKTLYQLIKLEREKVGTNKQYIYLIEELSELIKALCKNIEGRGDFKDILNELIDVEVVSEIVKNQIDDFDDYKNCKEKVRQKMKNDIIESLMEENKNDDNKRCNYRVL